MKKILKRMVLCGCLTAVVWVWGVASDREQLRSELIRLHVVANSDSPEDQAVKLQVRDAILESIQADLETVGDMEEAKAYLQENLPKLQEIANQALDAAGVSQEAVVSLCQEVFDIRQYDTFSLPSGIYESLRIVIGEGAGQNWWCVAFPALCLGAASEDFQNVAVNAGFSANLAGTLSREEGYEIRFFLLDALGRMEAAFAEKE